LGDAPENADEESGEGRRDLLLRPLSKLASALQTFPMGSDAWNDFLDACREILRFDDAGQPLDVGVTRNVWDYWSKVAAGQSGDYDAAGARVIDDQ
jgi:hypothetical protein